MRSIAFLISMSAASIAAADVCEPMSAQRSIDADRARVQQHLATVEAELRARDASHLPPEVRAQRALNLDRLHEYRVAGEFPHNTRADHRTPIFVDEDGRACAMAHLLLQSGATEAVARVVARENLARITEMSEPALGPWLRHNGLTLEEAARIQPWYDPVECCEDDGEPVCVEVVNAGGDVMSITHASRCVAEQECGEVVAYEGECTGTNVYEHAVDHCCSEEGCSTTGGASPPSHAWPIGLVLAIALLRRARRRARGPADPR